MPQGRLLFMAMLMLMWDPSFILPVALNCSNHHRMFLQERGVSPSVVLNFLLTLVTDCVTAIHQTHAAFCWLDVTLSINAD
jgi:hypothetical protein